MSHVPLEPVEPGERRLRSAESDKRDCLGDEPGVVGALAQLPVGRVQVAVHVRRRPREQRVESNPSLDLRICQVLKLNLVTIQTQITEQSHLCAGESEANWGGNV